MSDIAVYATAKRLLDCFVAELAQTRAGAPCVAVVHPGDMVPAYGCGCAEGEGQAWVRVAQITPSRDFPNPYLQPIRPTTVVQLAVVYELGIDRCYWSTEDNSMPDPPAILDSMARDAVDDAAAMRRAVWCCLEPDTVIPGMWVPRGPAGGIHGGTMLATALVDGWCGCDVVPPPLDTITPMLPGDPRG